jgi:16S rRNA (cytidine1402-2'-O)-methyltransferase
MQSIINTLYLVSVPIGNESDLSDNAKSILKSAGLIIGEEFKTTSKLLKKIGKQSEFELLNEHSKPDDVEELVHLIKKYEISCLFSDGGTPVLEDPGLVLVRRCIESEVRIKSIPGPSALLTALTMSGFSISPFTFCGFLPREKNEIPQALKKFISLKHTLVFYETPYRYKKTLEEMSKIFKQETPVFLGLDLTMDSEIQFRGKFKDIIKALDALPKALPVIVIDNK